MVPLFTVILRSQLLWATYYLCLELKKLTERYNYFTIKNLVYIDDLSLTFQLVCLVIATLQHFFTLSSFCWLMNEAFNLYILITYSTHSRTEHLDEGGSMLKYYIIGWGKMFKLNYFPVSVFFYKF